MRASCLSYPEKEPLILIRKSQLTLCDDNHCAAALLSFFEYWHNVKLEQRQQAEHANRVARQHGEEGTQDMTLLQYHTEEGLKEGLLQLYGHNMIRKGLTLLVTKGFVSIHENPNSRYHFDKTHYFLFHPEIVSSQLIEIYDPLKVTDASVKSNATSVKSNASCVKSNAPIAEITSEISSREEIPPPIRARAHEKASRGSKRCPADYEPSAVTRQWAQDKHPAVDFDEALEAVRDYEFSKLHYDWDATLKTWIRNEAKATKSQQYRRAPPTKAAQRKAAEDQSNRELEDLVSGRDTHNSVWASPRRNREDLWKDVGPGRQSRLPDGGGRSPV